MRNNMNIVNLGVGRTPVQVSLSSGATIVLFDNGDVVGFGSNYKAVLGDGVSEVPGNGVTGIDENGYYIGRTATEMGLNLPLLQFGTGVKVKALARGGINSQCVVLSSNKVKCWGGNTNGNLGLGDTTPRGEGPWTMGNNLPVVQLGVELPAATGVGQKPVCIQCEQASSWDTPSAVPNTALSVPHDAVDTTGDWRVSPRCMPSLSDGLVLHFTFDDAGLRNTAPKGPTMALIQHETTTLAMQIDVLNSTRVLPGRVGGAYMNLNYRHAYHVGSDATPVLATGTRRLTIAGWLKHVDPSDNIVWQLAPAGATDVADNWFHCSSSNLHILTCYFDNRDLFSISIPSNIWTHYTIVLDGIEGKIQVYIDGVLDPVSGSRPLCKLYSTSTWSTLSIGSEYFEYVTPDKFSTLGIDDVRLYNRMLSAEEVAALCPRDMRGLIFHAPYDVDVRDYSGYGRVATQIDDAYSFTDAGRVGLRGAMTPASLASVSYSPTFGVTDASMASGLAFSVWVKPVSGNHVTSIFSLKDTVTVNAYMHMYILSSAGNDIGSLNLQIRDPTTNVGINLKSTNDGNLLNIWTHIAVSIDSTGKASCWVDGIFASASTKQFILTHGDYDLQNDSPVESI